MTSPDQPAEIDRVSDSDPQPVDPKTAEQLEQEQIDEWNTYVAIYPIDYYGSRAYNPDDGVPVSAVESHGGWVPDRAVRKVERDAAAPVVRPGVAAVTVVGEPVTATAPAPDTADAAPADTHTEV